jgi:hypothetical protein
MKNSIRNGLAALAMLGMVSAHPAAAAAAGEMRSAAALPLIGASVGSVTYTKGAENAWHCTQVSDEALKLDKKYVQVDEAGRVVLDYKGVSFACRGPDGYQLSQGSGFPFKILLAALAGGGSGNDSTG